MTKKDNLIRKMVVFGISAKQAMIYSALLEKKELTAAEIQEITHIPRTKVYEIAHKMVLEKMCIEKRMRGKTYYQALAPGKFLNSIMQARAREFAEKKKLAKNIETLASPLYACMMSNPGVQTTAEIIKDQASIHERYINLLNTAKKEILGLIKPPYAHHFNAHRLKEQDDVLFGKIKQGLDVRILYETPAKKIKWIRGYIRNCIQQGEKARMIDSVPAKMYIFDERYIILALTDNNTGTSPLTMYTIDHPLLAKAGKTIFENLWEKALDYRTWIHAPGRDNETPY